MDEPYFTPWIGKNYEKTRTLILSESAYDWPDENGQVVTPQPSHAEGSIPWNIEHFGRVQYFTKLNRALCRIHEPTVEQMQREWDEYAYAIFIQESVGRGAGKRPKGEQWLEAGRHFLSLIEQIRPAKVIVTGRDMWTKMPDCTAARILDDLQAYKLKNGHLVWCLALPHPANRLEGFNSEKIGESIHLFRSTTFPSS